MNKFTFYRNIKRFDAIVPTRLIGVVPFVIIVFGVLLLYPYYFQIKYLPILDLTSFIYVAGYAFMSGSLTLLMFSSAFMLPGLFLSYIFKEDEILERIFFKETFKPTQYYWLVAALFITSIIISIIVLVFQIWHGLVFLLFTIPISIHIFYLHKREIPYSNILYFSMFSLISGLLLVLSIFMFYLIVYSISNTETAIMKSSLIFMVDVCGLAANLALPIFIRKYGSKIAIMLMALSVIFILIIVFNFGKTLSFALVRNANIGNYDISTLTLKPEGCIALKGLDKTIHCNKKSVTVVNKKITMLSSIGSEIYIKYATASACDSKKKEIYAKIKSKYYVSSGFIRDIPKKK